MRAHRPFRVLAALLLAGLSLAAMPAAAWPEAGIAPSRARHRARVTPAPAVPRAAIVSGYLPRNNSVPMYNEPPGMRSSGGPAW